MTLHCESCGKTLHVGPDADAVVCPTCGLVNDTRQHVHDGDHDGDREPWDDDALGEYADWLPRDLGPALAGELDRPEPTVLATETGDAMFYAGQVNGIHGDSGLGKSWVALVAAAQQLAVKNTVVWVDFEDPNEATIVYRLRTLGIRDTDITARFLYINPQSAASHDAVDVVCSIVTSVNASLVVIDSIGEAFGIEGINEDKDVDVGPWIRRVLRPLAATGTCVLSIDHGTKAADNPLHPSGSKRKRAAITGASYLVTAPKALTKDYGGKVTLTCAKDRHGNHARGKPSANIEFTVYPDGGMTWHVRSPSRSDDAPNQIRLAAKAATTAVRDYQQRNGVAPSTRAVIAEMTTRFTGSTDLKRAGIELAVADGAIRAESGPRNATEHHYVRDFDLAGPEHP